MTQAEAERLAGRLIEFLETGNVPKELFSPDVFCDFTMPKWRLQSEGIDGLVELRRAGHPGPGTVSRWRCDATERGFVLEFEEVWTQDGENWYSRELARADTTAGTISGLSVYCTGDWGSEDRSRHANSVRLIQQ